MASGRWKARAKGGRRAFLKVWLYGAAGSVGLGVAGNAGWALLTWGWHATFTAPRHLRMAADPMSFSVTLRSASSTWTGAKMDVYNRPSNHIGPLGHG